MGGSFGKAALEKKEQIKKRDASENKRSVAATPKPVLTKKVAMDEDEVQIKPLNKSKRQALDQRNKFPIHEVKGDHIEKL